MAGEDIEQFIRRVTRVTSLNLLPRDVESLQYKTTIRELVKQHISYDINWKMATTNTVDKDTINSKINYIRGVSNLDDLFKNKIKGPGEFLLFLIIDDAILLPDRQGEVDMQVGNKKYQVKSYRTSEEYVKDIRLSGFEISSIANRLMKLKESVGLGRSSGVRKGEIDTIKQKAKPAFDEIENDYKNLIYEEYFKPVEFIVFDSGSKLIKTIKNVKIDDISINRYESGTIRPDIKI